MEKEFKNSSNEDSSDDDDDDEKTNTGISETIRPTGTLKFNSEADKLKIGYTQFFENTTQLG